MTSTTSTNDNWSIDNKDVPVEESLPRKRRRKAAGTAVEDCYRCRARSIQCDRNRPYCSQCVDIGHTCSGYPTRLTWGFGVASRGKLRGQSCPVANKDLDGSNISALETTERETAKRRKSSTQKSNRGNEDVHGIAPSVPVHARGSELGFMSDMTEGSLQTYPPFQAPMTPDSQAGWHHASSDEHSGSRLIEEVHISRNQSRSHGLHNRHHSYDGVMLQRCNPSMVSYAESEYLTPSEHPHTPSSPPRYQQTPYTTSSYPSQHLVATEPLNEFNVNSITATDSMPVQHDPQATTWKGHMSTQLDQVALDTPEILVFNSEEPPNDSITSHSSYVSFDASAGRIQSERTQDDRLGLSLLDTRFTGSFYQISPRMQSLMQYYDRNICPWLVAFDGPENPYKHILQLALHNEGLQNAIAALSTNNLRMRLKEPHRVGFVQEIIDAFGGDTSKGSDAPTAEESTYKQASINQLNKQLTDRRAAQDDSVLATLLILCLFHVCDSGFSKFKTQLAGVQKILSLRESGTHSDFARWVQMFFTWFDVMTSTVNDREMQIEDDSMAMLDFSTNLGAMEQFSGCDGRLFKLIARLGRLNLLAQGRPVRLQHHEYHTSQPFFGQTWSTQRPSVRRMANAKERMNRSLLAADYSKIDGNGWGTPIHTPDEDTFGSADEEEIKHDERHEFWAEWNDIRDRLQSWQMDLPTMPSSTSLNISRDLAELQAGQRDMFHINEAFRCSALLYTERLGHPLRPSSHYAFQQLVTQALCHFTALPIDSCVNKFLLWPLFIIGTECVDEGYRDFIRSRCRIISSESGFFNNLSTLDVLEKVWMETPSSDAEEMRSRRRDFQFGQTFQWRKAMNRVDGEYIVL